MDYFLSQMDKMEGSNEGEGLTGAAAGMHLEEDEAGETKAAGETGEDTEKGPSSSSS